MALRRVLSLWFPRLAAERILRSEPLLVAQPVAVVTQEGNTQSLASLSHAASDAGLKRGMGLADARAIYPRPHHPHLRPPCRGSLPRRPPPLGRPLLPLGRGPRRRGPPHRHLGLRASLRRRGSACLPGRGRLRRLPPRPPDRHRRHGWSGVGRRALRRPIRLCRTIRRRHRPRGPRHTRTCGKAAQLGTRRTTATIGPAPQYGQPDRPTWSNPYGHLCLTSWRFAYR